MTMESNKSDSQLLNPKLEPQTQTQVQAQPQPQIQPQSQPKPQQQQQTPQLQPPSQSQQTTPQLQNQPQQVHVQIQPQQIQVQIQPQQLIQPQLAPQQQQTSQVQQPSQQTTLQLQHQHQAQPQQVHVQIQPQQIQTQIQPQQLMQPQLAPQLQSPQQLALNPQTAVVSASQLTQPQASIQPACSVATSSTVVTQLGQGPRGPNNQIRPAEYLVSTPSRLTLNPQTAVVSTPVSASQLPQPQASIQPPCGLHICCLLDNGVRCDRDAGNASFNARIQKIVGTKKMNFALDSTVRHAYICEHHKGIITVAKKSATLARDTKSNARNCTANSNANNLVSHPHPRLDYDYSVRQQQPLQHAGNLDLLNNQNRIANNHTGALNNMPVRQGAHLAYGHFQGAHTNQVGFDNAGGDSIPSSSGGIDVDLQQLQVNTLRRYKRHFRVPTRPGLNKMQLAESLKSHFRTLPIIEKEAITYFVYIVKCYRNKLDHNPKAD